MSITKIGIEVTPIRQRPNKTFEHSDIFTPEKVQVKNSKKPKQLIPKVDSKKKIHVACRITPNQITSLSDRYIGSYKQFKFQHKKKLTPQNDTPVFTLKSPSINKQQLIWHYGDEDNNNISPKKNEFSIFENQRRSCPATIRHQLSSSFETKKWEQRCSTRQKAIVEDTQRYNKTNLSGVSLGIKNNLDKQETICPQEQQERKANQQYSSIFGIAMGNDRQNKQKQLSCILGWEDIDGMKLAKDIGQEDKRTTQTIQSYNQSSLDQHAYYSQSTTPKKEKLTSVSIQLMNECSQMHGATKQEPSIKASADDKVLSKYLNAELYGNKNHDYSKRVYESQSQKGLYAWKQNYRR